MELTSKIFRDELVDGGNSDFRGSELVLKNFMAGVNEHQRGSLSSVNTNVVSKLLVVTETIIRLGDREDDLTSIFFSRSSKSLFSSKGSFVAVGEKEQGGVTLLEDLLDGSVVEGHNGGEGVSFNKIL